MKNRFSILFWVSVLLFTGCGDEGKDSGGVGSIDVNAPVFNSIADKAISPGDSLQFTALAIDPNGESITYSSTAVGSPDIYSQTSASFDTATATFSWTSTNADEGVYAVRFTATNTSQLSGTEMVIISVVGQVAQGKALFENTCDGSGCHVSEVSGGNFPVWQSTASEIQEAIRLNQGGMGSISLTSDERATIAAYLATVNP